MGFPYPYPLGLPKGSVRATLTLILSLDLVWLSLQQSAIADQVTTMTVVSLTFYFGGKMRSSAPIPRNTDASLRAWGLPAGTIRSLLIIIFGATSAYLQFIGDGIPDYLLKVINIIVGYLGGRMFEKIRNKIFKTDPENKKVGIIDHLKALLAIAVTAPTLYFTIFLPTNELTSPLILITSIVLGFYFGARD